jgi:hypothetical protein
MMSLSCSMIVELFQLLSQDINGDDGEQRCGGKLEPMVDDPIALSVPYWPKLATQLARSWGSLMGPHSLFMRLARKLPFACTNAS